MAPQDFIAALSGPAQASMLITNIPASFAVADAALESGWGDDCPGFNIYGIKATPDWTGAVTTDQTDEVENGQTVVITATFRAYPNWLASLNDHAQFLIDNPRYAPAFASMDGPGFAQAVAAAGYATDPLYAQKIIEIINTHGLMSLDTQGVQS